MKAFCWATGKIEFGRSVPEGAIQMAEGPAKLLRRVIGGTARLAYDNKTLLVPGIPEARNQDEAGDALGRHLDWLRQRSIPGVTFAAMRPRGRRPAPGHEVRCPRAGVWVPMGRARNLCPKCGAVVGTKSHPLREARP